MSDQERKIVYLLGLQTTLLHEVVVVLLLTCEHNSNSREKDEKTELFLPGLTQPLHHSALS
jgi:hypothetical protein